MTNLSPTKDSARSEGDLGTVYLDHAATTPLDPRVRAAMEPYLSREYGNPSSIHRLGQRARMAVDEARERVAAAIGADPAEIIFTSGGTESDSAAIRGAVLASSSPNRHVVTTAIEHEAVLETCSDLVSREICEVSYAPSGSDGLVDFHEIERAIRPGTVLISVMYANNEVGTIQPIAEIGELCRDRGIAFHVDAVQAVGSISVDVVRDNIDLMSLSAHKFHGPKGVGAMYCRTGTQWAPQQLGGGQERLRRSGTENVAGIVGMAEALDIAVTEMNEGADRLAGMRDFLMEALVSLPGAIVNGSRRRRLPGNVNVSFPGVSGEAMVMALDAEGLMVSSGSACSSGSTEPSHVLVAMGCPPEVANGALRITLGRENTWDEVRFAAERIVAVVSRLSETAARVAVS